MLLNNQIHSINMKPKVTVLAFIFTLFLFVSPVLALSYPEAYIEEKVDAEFYANGSIISERRSGSVKVLTEDILQDVTLELSSTDGTDLGSPQAYRPALSCPGGDPTALYLNTTESDKAVDYEIDPSYTPRIEVEVEYENDDGGVEIHSGENNFIFHVNIEASEDLEGAELRFTVPQDTGDSGEDSFNLKDQSCTGNYDYCRRINRDGDGYYESIEWKGDLQEGDSVNVTFKGVTEPGVNFDPGSPVDMDMGDYEVYYEGDSTFTDTVFERRSSKASARNGIDMTERDDGWKVKGFLMNRAQTLEYSVDGWELYRVGNKGEPLNNSTEDKNIGPGETVYTDPYYSPETEKQYYFSTFDWGVRWGDSVYRGTVSSEIEMPLLFVMESDLQKDLTIQKNDLDGRRIEVRDKLKNLGQEGTKVDRTEMFSIVPGESSGGKSTLWIIEDVSLLYRNYTDGEGSSYDVTNRTNITVKDPTSNSDGYVEVDMDTLNETVGYFEPNEELILEYTVKSNRKKESLNYTFSGNSTAWTTSGTPETQISRKNITIQGVEEPEDDTGGGGGFAPPKNMDLENIETTASVVTGNLIKIRRSDRVVDTGDRGMRNIDLGVLLPNKGELEKPSVEINYFKDGNWTELQAEDYVIEKVDDRTVDGQGFGFYRVKVLKGGEQGLVLENGDIINMTYDARLSFGSNDVVTRISYYDYYEDSFVDDDKTVPIRVGWEADPMDVAKDRWNQDEAIVDEPVRWTREITINNPNNDPMKRTLQVYLPDETFSCYVEDEELEIEERGRKFVNWEVEMAPLERNTFVFESYTPSVVLDSEDVSILQSNETSVEFMLNRTYRNYASHLYENVNDIINVPPESIRTSEVEGRETGYSEVNGSTKLSLHNFNPEETKTGKTVYRELAPVLVVRPDSYNYSYGENSEIKVLVVGREGNRGGHVELTVTESNRSGREVYSEVISLNNNTEFSRNVDLTGFPEGEYTIRAFFRRNFNTILVEESTFHVEGRGELFAVEGWYLAVFLLVAASAISFRVYRKKERYEEKMKDLRKKVRKKL